MSAETMRAALAAARRYLADQRPDEPPTERLHEVTWTFAIASAANAIIAGGPLADTCDATITLTWTMPSGRVVELTRSPKVPGWRSGATPLPEALRSMRGRHDRPEWPESELSGAFEELRDGRGRLTLKKEEWGASLERAWNRVVWMGLTMDGFQRWLLDQRRWGEIARVLFRHPGFALVLEDRTLALDHAGPLIDVVSLDGAPAPAKDHPELAARLALLDLSVQLPYWRAAQLAPQSPLPDAVRDRLRGVATAAAAWLLSESREVDDEDPTRECLQPRRDKARLYRVPYAPWSLDERSGAAMRGLARWTVEDMGAARLAVAQRVAAAEIRSPEEPIPMPAVLEAANIGYYVAIDRTVEDALERQAVFERTFVDLDKAVAEIRGSISGAVDQVVVRTLTGASAFTIAALASPRFRGVAALAAAVLISLFVVANLVLLRRPSRREAEQRLQDAEDHVVARRKQLDTGLSEILESRLAEWRRAIEAQISTGTLILVALIVALLLAGGLTALATDYEPATATPARTAQPA